MYFCCCYYVAIVQTISCRLQSCSSHRQADQLITAFSELSAKKQIMCFRNKPTTRCAKRNRFMWRRYQMSEDGTNEWPNDPQDLWRTAEKNSSDKILARKWSREYRRVRDVWMACWRAWLALQAPAPISSQAP